MYDLLLIFRFLIRPTMCAPELIRTPTSFKWLFIIGLLVIGNLITMSTFWYSSHKTDTYNVFQWLWIPYIDIAILLWICMRIWGFRMAFFDVFFLISCASLIILPMKISFIFISQEALIHLLVICISLFWFMRICTLAFSVVSGISKTKILISIISPFLFWVLLSIIFIHS